MSDLPSHVVIGVRVRVLSSNDSWTLSVPLGVLPDDRASSVVVTPSTPGLVGAHCTSSSVST